MTNYSGGGTPLCDANEYDGRGIQLEPSEVETNKRSITDPNVGGFKTYVASHIARKLERELSAARSALVEKGRPLRWLLSHCLAIGMAEKSIQDTPEHNIALFTINLKERAKAAEARAGEAEKDAKQGWDAFYKLREAVASDRYPNLTAVVRTAAPPASPTGRKE